MTTKEAFAAIKKLLFDLPAPVVAPVVPAPVAPPVAPAALATDYPLADGTVLSIDNLAVGGMVTIAGAPAPDNTYTLADGTSITTAAGVITMLTPVAAPAPELPAEMKTKEGIMAAIAKFAETPGSADMAVLLRALFENSFGYEIRRAKEQEAIALYNERFSAIEAFHKTQKEGLTQLVALVETMAAVEVTAPTEKIEKDWSAMSPLEQFRARK